MNIKSVIFDVDGVLLDSVPYHFKAWKKMFNEQGVDFSFQDYIERVNGLPRLTGIKNILVNLDKKTLEKLAEKKQGYLTDMVNIKPPKPLKGVVKLLKELRKMKIKIAAASSSKNSPVLLEKAGLSKYLDAVISGHDFSKSKPDPDIFLTAAKKINIKPADSIVIEDALSGIQAAKNAGMKTIGLIKDDKAIINEANFCVESLNEYKKILIYIKNII